MGGRLQELEGGNWGTPLDIDGASRPYRSPDGPSVPLEEVGPGRGAWRWVLLGVLLAALVLLLLWFL